MNTNHPTTDYYAGHYRLVRDGVPCRLAGWVRDLTPLARDGMLRGQYWDDEMSGSRITKAQRKALCDKRFPQTQYTFFRTPTPQQRAALVGLEPFFRACGEMLYPCKIMTSRPRRRAIVV